MFDSIIIFNFFFAFPPTPFFLSSMDENPFLENTLGVAKENEGARTCPWDPHCWCQLSGPKKRPPITYDFAPGFRYRTKGNEVEKHSQTRTRKFGSGLARNI